MLADRAGMIMSPTALQSAGDANFGTNPVCVGPFKFASRVAQDRIEVVKDSNYYDAAKVYLDKITYKIIADATTRFNNLRSGDVEVLDTRRRHRRRRAHGRVRTCSCSPRIRWGTRESPSTSATSTASASRPARWPRPGQPDGQRHPGAPGVRAEPRPRRHQHGGVPRQVQPGVRADQRGQPVLAPTPRRRAPSTTRPAAKALLTQAGVTMPFKISMVIGNTPEAARLGQAIQAQVKEGGFDLELAADRVRGLADPDRRGQVPDVPDRLVRPGRPGRQHRQLRHARNGSQNISGYSNSDGGHAARPDAHQDADVAARRDLYGQVITQAARGRAAHLPVPGEELHRRVAARSSACRCTATGCSASRRGRRLDRCRGAANAAEIGTMGRYVLRRLLRVGDHASSW